MEADNVTWESGGFTPHFLILHGYGAIPLGEMTDEGVDKHFTIYADGTIECHHPIDASTWRNGSKEAPE